MDKIQIRKEKLFFGFYVRGHGWGERKWMERIWKEDYKKEMEMKKKRKAGGEWKDAGMGR
jgi:hypothetical protein